MCGIKWTKNGVQDRKRRASKSYEEIKKQTTNINPYDFSSNYLYSLYYISMFPVYFTEWHFKPMYAYVISNFWNFFCGFFHIFLYGLFSGLSWFIYLSFITWCIRRHDFCLYYKYLSTKFRISIKSLFICILNSNYIFFNKEIPQRSAGNYLVYNNEHLNSYMGPEGL